MKLLSFNAKLPEAPRSCQVRSGAHKRPSSATLRQIGDSRRGREQRPSAQLDTTFLCLVKIPEGPEHLLLLRV